MDWQRGNKLFRALSTLLIVLGLCFALSTRAAEEDSKEHSQKSGSNSAQSGPVQGGADQKSEKQQQAEEMGFKDEKALDAVKDAIKEAQKEDPADAEGEDQKTAQEKAGDLYKKLSEELGKDKDMEKFLKENAEKLGIDEKMKEKLLNVNEAKKITDPKELSKKIGELASARDEKSQEKRRQFIEERNRRVQENPVARTLANEGGMRADKALEAAHALRKGDQKEGLQALAKEYSGMNDRTRYNLQKKVDDVLHEGNLSADQKKDLQTLSNSLQIADSYWDLRNESGAETARKQMETNLANRSEEEKAFAKATMDAMDDRFKKNGEVYDLIDKAFDEKGNLKSGAEAQQALNELRERYRGGEDRILDFIQEHQNTLDGMGSSMKDTAEYKTIEGQIAQWSKVAGEQDADGNWHLRVQDADNGMLAMGKEMYGQGGANLTGKDASDLVRFANENGGLEQLSINRGDASISDAVAGMGLTSPEQHVDISRNGDTLVAKSISADEMQFRNSLNDIANRLNGGGGAAPAGVASNFGASSALAGLGGGSILSGNSALSNALAGFSSSPPTAVAAGASKLETAPQTSTKGVTADKSAEKEPEQQISDAEALNRTAELSKAGLHFDSSTGMWSTCEGGQCSPADVRLSEKDIKSQSPEQWKETVAKAKAQAEWNKKFTMEEGGINGFNPVTGVNRGGLGQFRVQASVNPFSNQSAERAPASAATSSSAAARSSVPETGNVSKPTAGSPPPASQSSSLAPASGAKHASPSSAASLSQQLASHRASQGPSLSQQLAQRNQVQSQVQELGYSGNVASLQKPQSLNEIQQAVNQAGNNAMVIFKKSGLCPGCDLGEEFSQTREGSSAFAGKDLIVADVGTGAGAMQKQIANQFSYNKDLTYNGVPYVRDSNGNWTTPEGFASFARAWWAARGY